MTRLLGLRGAAVVALAVLLAVSAIDHLGGGSSSVASAATPAQQIGMRVLLITDSTDPSTPSGISYGDWVNTLNREGVPYDSVVTSEASPGSVPLPTLSSTLADGTEVGDYEGVVVSSSGLDGLSGAQWTELQAYEQHFSVRQVTAYAVPSSDYGLNTASPSSGAALSGALTLTSNGAGVFSYLNAVSLDSDTWAYEATPMAGANVDTLISGPNGSSMLGIYTSPDGRQTMYQTFNENQYMLQSELLRHGELAWLARSTYLGDQRNYLETDVDDNFLSDDAWSVSGNATTAPHSTDFNAADALREVPADITTAAAWSRQNNLRIDMLFNGGGSVAVADGDSLVGAGDSGSGGTGSTTTTTSSNGCTSTNPCPDPLLAAFQATDPATGNPYTDDFGWISHTWDHPNVDEGCATQNYIEAEINQNTNWAATPAAGAGDPINGGLGLTISTNPSDALGVDNPNVIITGEHSGLPNLLPGNPGQVDPPSLDTATPATTGGSLATGDYEYAVSDQFNSAAPGTTPLAGSGQSAASVSLPVSVTGPDGSVTLSWSAVCHAADYLIFRAPYSGTAPGGWSLIASVPADTTNDFLDPSDGSTTNTAGGGAGPETFTDTGIAGTATGSAGAPTATSEPSSEGSAVESAYEQNPVLDAAFAGTLDGGIKYFGADASKPYPDPANGAFTTGAYGGAEYPAGATFSDAGATGIPRYPTNIYYNVSTNAQEVDEYETLYDSPTCVPVSGVTTCNPAGTQFSISQIVASADQEMFQHMMGNDPRPHYFHQTNLMAQTTGTVNGVGDGLYYEAMNPLLAEYHEYFASNAPIEQLTMPQIGTLLDEQDAWAGANAGQVTGYIEGALVTVTNTGSAIETPLTGTTIGSPYAGSQSGWVLAPSGTSTYTALAAWPPAPPGPVTVRVPGGPAPNPGQTGKLPGPAKLPVTPGGGKRATTQGSVCIQVPPVTVSVKHGKVTVSLKCKAALGFNICTGRLSLTVDRQTVTVSFRIQTRKMARITIKLPKRAQAAAGSRRHNTLHAKLKISTRQPRGPATNAAGRLSIKT